MTLSTLPSDQVTELGSMLFTRNVSGARVVGIGASKQIEDFKFVGFGSHCNTYPYSYLTVAAAIGMKQKECDQVIERLEKAFNEIKKRFLKK